MEEVIKLNAVDQYNKMFGLETLHPLVSVVDLSEATGYPRHFTLNYVWGIERSGFFNDRGKWAKGFENQRV